MNLEWGVSTPMGNHPNRGTPAPSPSTSPARAAPRTGGLAPAGRRGREAGGRGAGNFVPIRFRLHAFDSTLTQDIESW